MNKETSHAIDRTNHCPAVHRLPGDSGRVRLEVAGGPAYADRLLFAYGRFMAGSRDYEARAHIEWVLGAEFSRVSYETR